jgi:hypothetical protein
MQVLHLKPARLHGEIKKNLDDFQWNILYWFTHFITCHSDSHNIKL